MTATACRCPLCRAPMRRDEQPALLAHRQPTVLHTCPRCYLTLDERDLPTFDAAVYRTAAALVDGAIARGAVQR